MRAAGATRGGQSARLSALREGARAVHAIIRAVRQPASSAAGQVPALGTFAFHATLPCGFEQLAGSRRKEANGAPRPTTLFPGAPTHDI